ncbi:ABC-type transport auxiliary lipoprotein family protein [Quisquiliibacterium transsilvanicum]|uniref:ABC-type uncharacterized transport system auxiliary subunit n=1 Tax=Quisquiliibacterium transsilvanicum TaxID=1549638 RepID=A0A7W8MA55_9BURK|nr:ABC-type transport auxiliary lipoprotein family protein [Quisquiliibacterium transsilvanicum]MBB5273568.1 ABC-type uncharacterized transport system auxiliary subunit [Quisquiliibacterium transsilvanicum]
MTAISARKARRAVVTGLPALAAMLAGGCAVLGGNPEPRQWHRLEDLAALARAPGPAIPRVLLVEMVSTASLHDGAALVYSRDPGLLAHYRFADWAEPPARRIAHLVERRLDGRGRFRAVGQSTAGLGGDLLLRVGLDEFFHDASTEPGVARLALDADLIDWRARTRVARRRFVRTEALAFANAAGAAAALSRALSAALDELAPWVEAAAAG